ncbi:MAG TPA: hypothetical protein VHX90_05065 [Verrucomicrobiae bacterium]|jgi:hypothetical protein|nr:hypothetical protein [Verrucomicrobiae bacterium]
MKSSKIKMGSARVSRAVFGVPPNIPAGAMPADATVTVALPQN